MKSTLAALTLAAAAVTAQAHQVWIEQNAKGATLYFGEYGGNLREASPGLLDKFIKPQAVKLGAAGEQALTTAKTAQGFALGARAGKGEALIAEEPAYPISERTEGGRTTRSAYHPAARLAGDFSAAQAPRLTLDLVPTGNVSKHGIELQAFFKGQPLPKAKVEVMTASGWSQTHYGDEAGKLRVAMPWRGTYVAELSHRDKQPGQRADGQAYDRVSYVTSLTLMQPSGLPALPALPAAEPNKMN